MADQEPARSKHLYSSYVLVAVLVLVVFAAVVDAITGTGTAQNYALWTGNTSLGIGNLTENATGLFYNSSQVCTGDNGICGNGSGGGLSAVVDDTTPQLGGALDVNGSVINASYGNIVLTPPNDVEVLFAGFSGANYMYWRNSFNQPTHYFDDGGFFRMTGPFTSGNAGAPIFSMFNDGNTGFFSACVACDEMGITVGGQEYFYFDEGTSDLIYIRKHTNVDSDVNLTTSGSCYYLPNGGKVCDDASCTTMFSPNGNNNLTVCN